MEQSESHDFYRFKGVVIVIHGHLVEFGCSISKLVVSTWISVNLDQFPKAWGENKQISETTT